MNQLLHSKKQNELGMACAILCALVWGILPIYWKSLHPINSLLIMFYRLVLACIVVFLGSLIVYKWKGIIEPLKKKEAIPVYILAGIVISTNWGLYIWMVNAGFIVQTSIGYYIEPLVICIFGAILLKEKIEKYTLAAFIIAGIGVVIMIFSYGEVPLLAIVLAMTFATYALIKKKLQIPALLSLFYETFFLLPVVIPCILYMEFTGRGAFTQGEPYQIGLLFLSGLFTAIPLSLFAMAANRISLIALGITEYISPSMALILGIFIYKETFDLIHFIGFIIIWIGLIIFTAGGIRSRRQFQGLEQEGQVNGRS